MIGHRPPEWTQDAKCIGMTGRDFDPWSASTVDGMPVEEVTRQHYMARLVCAQCPVRLACAMDALADLPRNEPHAIRGGLTPDEQIDLARSLGMKHRREAQHGTRSRYVSGCRCADCRDAHRVYEHDRRLWAKKRRVTRVDVYAHLTVPLGRGRRAGQPGQLVLFTDGLPPAAHSTPGQVAA